VSVSDEAIQRDLGFDEFTRSVGEQVRRALVAFYGVEIGTEAAAEALSVTWERWSEVSVMGNPAGFVFRVGQSKARPHVRWWVRRDSFPSTEGQIAAPDGARLEVLDALRRLKPEQRAAVVLVKSHGYSYREAADILGVSEAAVTNHVHRGLTRLRTIMEVD
jgi:RNA polymerase sigma-70 factor (ECF subfamily)